MATPPTGCVVNTSLFAAPTVITTLPEPPVEVRPVRVATNVYVPRGGARDLAAREGRDSSDGCDGRGGASEGAGCWAGRDCERDVPGVGGDGVAVEVLHRHDRRRPEHRALGDAADRLRRERELAGGTDGDHDVARRSGRRETRARRNERVRPRRRDARDLAAANVATPATAATVVAVQVREPAAGPVAMRERHRARVPT